MAVTFEFPRDFTDPSKTNGASPFEVAMPSLLRRQSGLRCQPPASAVCDGCGEQCHADAREDDRNENFQRAISTVWTPAKPTLYPVHRCPPSVCTYATNPPRAPLSNGTPTSRSRGRGS